MYSVFRKVISLLFVVCGPFCYGVPWVTVSVLLRCLLRCGVRSVMVFLALRCPFCYVVPCITVSVLLRCPLHYGVRSVMVSVMLLHLFHCLIRSVAVTLLLWCPFCYYLSHTVTSILSCSVQSFMVPLCYDVCLCDWQQHCNFKVTGLQLITFNGIISSFVPYFKHCLKCSYFCTLYDILPRINHIVVDV